MLIESRVQQQLAVDNITTAIITSINEELERRINLHKYLYDLMWNDAAVTPQDICDGLMAKGFKPATLFAISANNKSSLDAICAACNKSLSDFISSEYLKPKLPFIVNPDGSITIGVKNV